MEIKQKRQKGFTLIELLVVVSIIGVLTALLLANFVGIRARAADTSKKNALRQMKTALRLYYNDNQSYPDSGVIDSCDGGPCGEGSEFNSEIGGSIYMKEIPLYVGYLQTNNGDGFTVGILLSNSSDSDIESSADSCGISPGVEDTFYVCSD